MNGNAWSAALFAALLAICLSQTGSTLWAQAENPENEPAADTSQFDLTGDGLPGGDPAGEKTSTSPAAEKKSPTAGVTAAPAASESEGWPWYAKAAFVIALLALPIFVGNQLAKSLRMEDYAVKFSVVIGSIFIASVVTYMRWPPNLAPDLSGGINLIYQIAEDAGEGEQQIDMGELIDALSRRINPGGIKEVTIRPYGTRQVEIIIPRADTAEVDLIKEKIVTAGALEFRILANRRDHEDEIQAAEATDAYDVVVNEEKVAQWVKVDTSQFPGESLNSFVTRTNQRGETEALVVMDIYNVTGEDLSATRSGIDDVGKPAVNFELNQSGESRFADLTTDYGPDKATGFQRQLGIILDDTLLSAPSLREPITGGSGQISGNYTQEEVDFLIGILNAGKLPAALVKTPISEQETTATVGAYTVQLGTRAMIVSMLLVIVFMLVYYRFAGIVACLALTSNLVLILGTMILIKADFSLPGIAGLVLTVGMAVDANVLIFERMREELIRGAALRMAIRNGFEKATRTIVDANVTTLLTAVVLFWIGTDQIKGFAVTLILGILMSMFTAIYCSRLVFDIAERRRWLSELKMLRLVSDTSIDFLGRRRLAGAVSAAVILVGLAGVFGRGKNLLDIDFVGGTSVTIAFKEPTDLIEVREKLNPLDTQDGGLPDLTVVGLGQENLQYKIVTSNDDLESVQGWLEQTFEGRLRTNRLDFTPPKPASASASRARSEMPLAAAAGDFRAETPLPPETEIAAADDSVLALLQAGSDDETSDATPKEKPEQPAGEAGKSTAAVDAPNEAPDQEQDESQAADNNQDVKKQSASETDPAAGARADANRADAAPADDASKALQTEESADKKSPKTAEEAASPAAADVPDDDKKADPPAAETGAASAAGVVHQEGPELVTELTFGEKVKHDTLQEALEIAFEQSGVPRVPFTLSATGGEDEQQPLQNWTLRMQLSAAETRKVLEQLQSQIAGATVFPESSKIGGKVAGDTQAQAGYALFASLVLIVGYIWARFQQITFGLAAVVALVHDVLVTLGMLALSAYVANYAGPAATALLIDPFKISLPIVAAFLTIIGYSLNDTIVVFDRIREVRGKSPALTAEMINTSINQTLGRTLLTSLTTLIVVAILYIAGGPGIHGFAFALVIGVVVGTYSSVFVASPVLLWMNQPSRQQQSRAKATAA